MKSSLDRYGLRYESIEDRLILGSLRLPNGCWDHPTSRKDGYAVISYGGRDRPAHCISYEVFVGPIPHGMEIDHLCRNRSCVNPSHLEPVPHIENVRRGEPATRTHCPRGHLLPPVVPGRDRRCRKCRNIARADWAKRNPDREQVWRKNYQERKRNAINRTG